MGRLKHLKLLNFKMDATKTEGEEILIPLRDANSAHHQDLGIFLWPTVCTDGSGSMLTVRGDIEGSGIILGRYPRSSEFIELVKAHSLHDLLEENPNLNIYVILVIHLMGKREPNDKPKDKLLVDVQPDVDGHRREKAKAVVHMYTRNAPSLLINIDTELGYIEIKDSPLTKMFCGSLKTCLDNLSWNLINMSSYLTMIVTIYRDIPFPVTFNSSETITEKGMEKVQEKVFRSYRRWARGQLTCEDLDQSNRSKLNTALICPVSGNSAFTPNTDSGIDLDELSATINRENQALLKKMLDEVIMS